MNEITVVLPAYNEEDNLEQLVYDWQRYQKQIFKEYNLELTIIVVNDGSADHTRKIGEKLEKKYHNFILVNHEKNKGLGETVKTGIFYVLKNRPQSVFSCLMDCDNTHNPKYVLDMLEKQKIRNSDVVIASRYQNGALVKGVSSLRLMTSEGAKCVYSLILRVKGVKDYTCGYRLYKNTILQRAYGRFGDKLIEESGFTCMAELLYKLYASGAQFSEVPFILRYDFKKGASKMKVFKTALDSFQLAFRLKKIKREA